MATEAEFSAATPSRSPSESSAAAVEIIRPLASLEEFKECVAIQREVWGAEFSELVPVAMLKASQRVGGIASGAFLGDKMIGFVYGITGWEDGRPVHWSDMLAVRPSLRSVGLGSRLKWYQREALLPLGVEVMYWTFDPLQAKNAYLNIEKLGVITSEYHPDMYGETDSPLHRGIGTDRFVARWELVSDRVAEKASGAPTTGVPTTRAPTSGVPTTEYSATGTSISEPATADASATRASTNETPRAANTTAPPKATQAFTYEVRAGVVWPQGDVVEPPADAVRYGVPIPSDIDALKEASVAAAVAWRKASRTALQGALSEGFVVRGFQRGDAVSYYWLHR